MDVMEKQSSKKRLIDVNDIYSLFNQNGIARLHVSDIDTIPRVDAVEVVRCEDCKYLMFSDCYGECGEGHMGIVSPDDFCSYGKKKEGADNVH